MHVPVCTLLESFRPPRGRKLASIILVTTKSYDFNWGSEADLEASGHPFRSAKRSVGIALRAWDELLGVSGGLSKEVKNGDT